MEKLPENRETVDHGPNRHDEEWGVYLRDTGVQLRPECGRAGDTGTEDGLLEQPQTVLRLNGQGAAVVGSEIGELANVALFRRDCFDQVDEHRELGGDDRGVHVGWVHDVEGGVEPAGLVVSLGYL